MDRGNGDRVIDYPSDNAVQDQAREHGIPPPVLIRDLVRVVEVINLRERNFFNKRSVLAGSMGLRSFGSPRFTVYDADFSTSTDTVNPETKMKEMLSYEDDDLVIAPAPLVPSADGGDAWKSAPIGFEPTFTALVPDQRERTFKADVSFRGLVREGMEMPLQVPYDLKIWSDPPTVFVMNPVETVAEKILGWCVHGLVKHYADLAYIAVVSIPGPAQLIELRRNELRETAADKLEKMRGLQPQRYAAFNSLEALIRKLEADPQIDQSAWDALVYLKARRHIFTPAFVQRAVQEILVPLLR
jgi:hypothetical protein